MKLSKILLSTLFTSAAIAAQAQTKPAKPKAKPAAKTTATSTTCKPAKANDTKTIKKELPREITANYCPPCGKG